MPANWKLLLRVCVVAGGEGGGRKGEEGRGGEGRGGEGSGGICNFKRLNYV